MANLIPKMNSKKLMHWGTLWLLSSTEPAGKFKMRPDHWQDRQAGHLHRPKRKIPNSQHHDVLFAFCMSSTFLGCLSACWPCPPCPCPLCGSWAGFYYPSWSDERINVQAFLRKWSLTYFCSQEEVQKLWIINTHHPLFGCLTPHNCHQYGRLQLVLPKFDRWSQRSLRRLRAASGNRWMEGEGGDGSWLISMFCSLAFVMDHSQDQESVE